MEQRRNLLVSRYFKLLLLIGLLCTLIAIITLASRTITLSQFWTILVGIGSMIGLLVGIIELSGHARKAVQKPIEVEYRHRLFGNNYDGIIENLDPDKTLDYYERKGLLIYSHFILTITVTNRSAEAVLLAPYLVVAMVKVEPISETVDYVARVKGPGGAAGVARLFKATFSPDRSSIFGVPQVCSMTESREYEGDFFALAPGESEMFILYPGNNGNPPIPQNSRMLPGFYYHFRVGIQYSHKRKQSVLWSDSTYVAGIPTAARKIWSYDEVQERFVEYSEHVNTLCNRSEGQESEQYYRMIQEYIASNGLSLLPPNIDQDNIAKWIRAEEEATGSYRSSFSLPTATPNA